MSRMKLDLNIFGVPRNDPGYIYIISDKGRFKIGKTKNPKGRARDAGTWLPDMQLIGMKPFWNVSRVERMLHEGFCRGWYHGEWFEFEDKIDENLLLEGFLEFSNEDRDTNSVDFIYWYNSSGIVEFQIERDEQGVSLPKFMKQESVTQKKRDK